MSRKGQSITLSISDREKKQLEALAIEFGMLWGDKPNISKLVNAIARNHLQIVRNNDWSTERIKVLETARKVFIDEGKMLEALEIGRLLSSRSELTNGFKKEIETFLDKPQPAWRQRIDDLIQSQQPFRLSYRDAGDRQFNYTVLFAKIEPIEKRKYLVCCCEETEGNFDIPELCHNWTLRLDRIVEAAVIPLSQTWLELETIPVEFHLFGTLAFGYRGYKPGDIFLSELEGNPPHRRVIRDIYSTFWLIREILPYGADCEIVAPKSVRSRFIEQQLKALNRRYGINPRN
ncbi:MAG: WYL domain-containing protein [Oscillatoria sp. PMC 1068.18]|nr:WYL domain-containing protein [Oscillatoria sp. PMC 1076.18]MEC4987328.1 WYL domain-containing protein [Oscillatoria sp. PMC 1068.18]